MDAEICADLHVTCASCFPIFNKLQYEDEFHEKLFIDSQVITCEPFFPGVERVKRSCLKKQVFL